MKLSIIIPVYNVAEYLPDCLNSILCQSFKDFEIICINDGSTDNSLDVLKSFNDERIVIINKENEGQGVARNVGAEKAKGEYLFFVDSDDWIEDNCLEKIVNRADELKTDILIFGAHSCYKTSDGYKKQNGGYSANKLPKKYFNKVFSSNDIKKDIFKFPSTAWVKLYRRDFFEKNNIKFQAIKVGEDQLPFFHSMICADRIALYPENFYCYRKNRTGSAMTVKKKNNFSPIYVFYEIEKLLKDKKEFEYIFVNKYFSKATSWLGKFQDDLKNNYFEEYSKLLSHIKAEYPCGWWQKFNPTVKDNYRTLKLKQLVAKLLYNH